MTVLFALAAIALVAADDSDAFIVRDISSSDANDAVLTASSKTQVPSDPTPVPAPVSDFTSTPIENPTLTPNAPGGSGGSFMWIILIVVAVTVVIGAGVGYFFYMRTADDAADTYVYTDGSYGSTKAL